MTMNDRLGMSKKVDVDILLPSEIPFRAVVADSLYVEDRGFRSGLRELKQPYEPVKNVTPKSGLQATLSRRERSNCKGSEKLFTRSRSCAIK